MKILLGWFPIDDPGGIINHNEQLSAGLMELGHRVDTVLFLPREDMPRNGVAGGRGSFSPWSRMEFDQRRGYSWPRWACQPYRGRSLKEACDLISTYDMVIWQVAVPTRRAENRGNLDWIKLYHANPHAQYAMIHDGNFLSSYPWLHVVEQQLRGIFCVHDCAMNSAKNISVPSALLLNPQEVDLEFTERMIQRDKWVERKPGFLSLQTFKAWKHVPELVAAMPYMPTIKKMLAGKGIDYYYLTSKDKCKYPGIWDKAIASGMEYLDVITNEQRDELLQGVTCLVDPSWSKKYSAIGGHFNRVLVDAIKMGATPVARPLGISTNLSGIGETFVAGHNCEIIPQNATPREYGETLEHLCHRDYTYYRYVMENCLVEVLPRFDRRTVANRLINLHDNGSLSFHLGSTTQQVRSDSADAVMNFFNDRG